VVHITASLLMGEEIEITLSNTCR